MDALSYVMQSLSMRSRLRLHAELNTPWGFSVPAKEQSAVFYYLWRGSGVLDIDGKSILRVNAGDIALVPGTETHRFRDSAQTAVVPFDEFLSALREPVHSCKDEGYGGSSVIVSGEFLFQSCNTASILSGLTPYVVVRAADESTPWLEMVLKLVCRELTNNKPGAEIAVTRLLDSFFIEILRVSMGQHAENGAPCGGNMLRALFDPQLKDAMAAIHNDPGRPWTVAVLAELSGMSRTAFATRFTAVAGVPPLAYITSWRMSVASRLLRQSDRTVAAIAEASGYESEAAFSAAFKRQVGIAPGAYRRSRDHVA